MPCLLAIGGLTVPRVVIVLLVIFTDYIGRAFDSFLWPLLGFFFLPTTTLAWAWAENTRGEVGGVHALIVVLAAAARPRGHRRRPVVVRPPAKLPDCERTTALSVYLVHRQTSAADLRSAGTGRATWIVIVALPAVAAVTLLGRLASGCGCSGRRRAPHGVVAGLLASRSDLAADAPGARRVPLGRAAG